MYRESANLPEEPKGPTVRERLRKWWEGLKERWTGERLYASILFFLCVSAISFFVSLPLARHQGDDIYWESIPAKIAIYTVAVSLLPILAVGVIWMLAMTKDLFLVMIGKKKYHEII